MTLTVQDVAARYGIDLIEVSGPELRAARCGAPPTAWATLSFDRKAVLHLEHARASEIFHEMMHLLLTPPSIDQNATVNGLAEDFVLLQVERAIASGFKHDGLRRVVNWQEETAVALFEEAAHMKEQGLELGYIDGYESKRGWTDGIAIAQEIGVLDEQGKPTWRWPTWTAVALHAVQYAMDLKIVDLRRVVDGMRCWT